MTPGVLCFGFILLVPFAAAGLALMNTGLGRSRNAAHTMLACLCVPAVAALAYLACGFALQTYSGGRFGGLFLSGVKIDASPLSLQLLLGLLSAGIAAMIPFGAGSERWRFAACCTSTLLFAGVIFPLFGHSVWGGGWLAQIGFRDTGGASTIHALGGFSALSIAWLLGPRRGKYVSGLPAALPGHNAVLVLLGCFLALVGWLGLNCAGALLYNHLDAGSVVLVALNTILAASSAALAAALVTRARYNRPDASLCANGWTGGLVAGSAVAAFANPAAAALIGCVAGALVAFSVETLDLRLAIDDPGGAISVHAVAAVWGLLAVSFFAEGNGLAQLAGIATLLGFVFPVLYGMNWLVGKFVPLRVTPEGERAGLDLHELGAGAYPEFITHHDDLSSR